MKLVMYQDCISPHQVPLARELAQMVGVNDFRYVYRDMEQSQRSGIGWDMRECDAWFVHAKSHVEESRELVESVDCLLTMFRDVVLLEKRAEKGLMTFVQTERWFKPSIGMLRLLVPSYRRMAERFVRLLDVGGVVYLPIGIHAASDMARLCGLMHGDLRCLFRAPELDFERKPGGKIWLKNGGDDRKYCLDKMCIWAYYVETSKFDALPVQESSDPRTSQQTRSQRTTPTAIRVLWVGRLLNWKRVDTIVRAVGEHANLKRVDNSLPKITLDIYGAGPEESRLKKMALKYDDVVKFYPPVPIDDVRKLMREHDIYVLASNGYEGWGAVVSEALEEGMRVIGTYEAGSSATMLYDEQLFHSGDFRGLEKLLTGEMICCNSKKWNAVNAAGTFLDLVAK